jgi:hypothetical protein
MQRVVSIEAARISAMEVLRAAPIASVRHLKETCETGGIIGKRYDCCIFGTLTKGSGVSLSKLPDEEVFEAVVKFGKSIGITVKPNGPHLPIEKYIFHVHARDTASQCEELAHLALWCDMALEERETPVAMHLGASPALACA